MIRKFFLTMIAIGLFGCGLGGLNLQQGIQSFRSENYRQAFIQLFPEARRGNPDAQYAVGYMYYYGDGVAEDRKKARFWICCAAKNGQPEAIVAVKIFNCSDPLAPSDVAVVSRWTSSSRVER